MTVRVLQGDCAQVLTMLNAVSVGTLIDLSAECIKIARRRIGADELTFQEAA